MISVFCDSTNGHVILGLQALTSVAGSHGRLTITYQCVCGRRGNLLTGRGRIGGGMSGHISV